MTSESSYDETLEEARRVVSEMQGKTFDACTLIEDASDIITQQQELNKSKQDVKDKFHRTVTLNSFMQNLSQPRQKWDSIITHNDEELRAARSSLKEAQLTVEEKKTQSMQLNAVVAEALLLYQENLKTLKESLQCAEKMLEELRSLEEKITGTDDDEVLKKEIQASMMKNATEIKDYRKEILHLEHKEAQLQLQVSQFEDDLQQLSMTFDQDQERMDAQCLSRLQKSITTMESLCGVTCTAVNSNTITVEFPPRQAGSPSLGDKPSNDFVLQLTLTFQENDLGSMRLSAVKSNMESLEVDDLWKRESSTSCCSLPKLISDIKLRWFSHVPLLSEISHLQSKFAIDWIQEDNILRVIVGKGGSIVCSLKIPPGYPEQGQVMLTNIMGCEDAISVEDLKPSMGNRLEDWVQFLEGLFGKP